MLLLIATGALLSYEMQPAGTTSPSWRLCADKPEQPPSGYG